MSQGKQQLNEPKLYCLPDDVLFAILSFCNVNTLLSLACVNRNLNRVASHDAVWRRISKRCINLRKSDKNIRSSESWKALCRVSVNWARGCCRDRCMLKFKTNFMPCLCLTGPRELIVAQGPDVILYNNMKKSRTISLWQKQVVFKGHQHDINHFVCRGDQLISCGVDNTIRTWSMTSGGCNGVFTGHTGSIQGVDGYGDIIVSGGRDKMLKVWSHPSKECIHTIPLLDNVWCVAMNPVTSTVLSGTAGYSNVVPAVQLWSLATGALVRNLDPWCHRFGAGVLSVLWETPFTFLSCGYDTNVRYWDTRLASRCCCVLKWEDPHDSTVYCIDSDTHWMIVSGTSRYGVVRIWDKRVKRSIRSFYAGRNSQSPVYSLQFDRTALYVALANGVRSLDFSI